MADVHPLDVLWQKIVTWWCTPRLRDVQNHFHFHLADNHEVIGLGDRYVIYRVNASNGNTGGNHVNAS